jgi:hypothetical protein
MSGLKENQEIQVKYFGRDPVTGQMRLSRKALFVSSFRSRNLLTQENGFKISNVSGINNEICNDEKSVKN